MFDALRNHDGKHDARPLSETDPEFVELFSRFAYGEVVDEPGANHPDLDNATRSMAILATLIGCQGADEYEAMLPVALDCGVSPVQVKEIVYQATAYLGFGRTLPFFGITNRVLASRGVALPLPPQSTTTPETRAQAGEQAQVDIFGERMRGFASSGPQETRHINKWLAGNCFGDYYTRGGLDLRQREMVTLCYLAAQGGCEPQLTAHAAANMRIGNGKAFLIAVVSQCMPYIGYPRTLNALRCINDAAASATQQ
ncbi:carboxymuconolactone decarboxylase family protein [Bifidobacterium leontopitheci]|uniref:Carboxymuconolactone decarboxylase n=1 Tax=Bifidobacterium leontopitheci TaxID=2650774 RepID=A0A6I1GMS7_9BIFI|nr:carboxymuconolactone decarboxylase family protein [Bifidobacterium leontopitheci]KAB7790719.1 carboxymuconolactone decarboxylase [Bifidobacterium leontopitheci]